VIIVVLATMGIIIMKLLNHVRSVIILVTLVQGQVTQLVVLVVQETEHLILVIINASAMMDFMMMAQLNSVQIVMLIAQPVTGVLQVIV
jgi:hypothetical protein